MSGLGVYQNEEEAETKNSKIIHWVIMAVIVGGIGLYVAESGFFSQQVAQTAKTYPRGL